VKVYLIHFKLEGQKQFTGYPAVMKTIEKAYHYAKNCIEQDRVTEVEVIEVEVE